MKGWAGLGWTGTCGHGYERPDGERWEENRETGRLFSSWYSRMEKDSGNLDSEADGRPEIVSTMADNRAANAVFDKVRLGLVGTESCPWVRYGTGHGRDGPSTVAQRIPWRCATQ